MTNLLLHRSRVLGSKDKYSIRSKPAYLKSTGRPPQIPRKHIALADLSTETPQPDDMDVASDIPGTSLVGAFAAHGGNWSHSVELQSSSRYDKIEAFRNNANRVLRGSFPVQKRPRNVTASVLMLKWKDDDLGVNTELLRLREVFHYLYHFETEIWEIPSWRAAQELSNKIYEWKHRYCEDETCAGEPLPLLILFYGGHAEKVLHSCRWRSNLNPATSVFLNWSTIQPILFDDADADVLVLLDTCHAGSARSGATATGKGAKEILAACGEGVPVTGVEHRSFTTLLTDELTDAAHENQLRGKLLTVLRLHGDMNDNDKLRTQPFYAMVNKNGCTSIPLVPFPVPEQRRPRITATYRIRLSIQTSASPDEGLTGFLRNECVILPYVTGITIEDIINENNYQADSSLPLVSLPLSMWDRGWNQGSCFACWGSEQKCIPGEPPCAKCQNLIEKMRFRLWTSPSVSIQLERLFGYFLPRALVFHLRVPQVHAFFTRHIRHFSRIFQLRLSVGLGEPWKFWAAEFDPKTNELYDMFGFHGDAVTERQCIVQLISPPVIPIWVDPLLMQISIDCWLDGMIGNPEADWQHHCFPEPSEIWQFSILDAICRHYQAYKPDHDRLATTSYQTLRWALKLMLLSYIMGHPFIVPEGDKVALFQSLTNPRFRGRSSEERVCPRAANKYIKMIILPLMRLVVQKTLSGLYNLLQARGPDILIWENAFAVTFLCLVVISSTQRSLFERAFVCTANNDLSFSRQDAVSEVQSIDAYLVVHLIGMFHERFQTMGPVDSFNPLAEHSQAKPNKLSSFSPFAARVRNATELYFRQSVAAKLSGDLGAERLLALFMRPFYQER